VVEDGVVVAVLVEDEEGAVVVVEDDGVVLVEGRVVVVVDDGVVVVVEDEVVVEGVEVVVEDGVVVVVVVVEDGVGVLLDAELAGVGSGAVVVTVVKGGVWLETADVDRGTSGESGAVGAPTNTAAAGVGTVSAGAPAVRTAHAVQPSRNARKTVS
jgi:hypothetical protein